MKSPKRVRQNGIVAVLDALGTASYSDSEVEEFLKSAAHLKQLLSRKVENVQIDPQMVSIFTFNDTVLIALQTEGENPDVIEVQNFFKILRKFLVDSLSQSILFRGAVSVGTFYVDAQLNTVMGQAVTDAAAWYNMADWIGIQTTPKTTIVLDGLMERGGQKMDHLVLPYDVPLKGGRTVAVKAINWPKVFFVESLTPCEEGETPRAKFLGFLSKRTVPMGVEGKFFNTIQFFDDAAAKIKKRPSK